MGLGGARPGVGAEAKTRSAERWGAQPAVGAVAKARSAGRAVGLEARRERGGEGKERRGLTRRGPGLQAKA